MLVKQCTETREPLFVNVSKYSEVSGGVCLHTCGFRPIALAEISRSYYETNVKGIQEKGRRVMAITVSLASLSPCKVCARQERILDDLGVII